MRHGRGPSLDWRPRYELCEHPRIFTSKPGLAALAEKARGPLAEEYKAIKAEADRELQQSPRASRNRYGHFDRVDATRATFPKTWFLHIPGEPQVSGEETVLVPGHVFAYRGGTATWLADPAGTRRVLSTGRSRAFLKTLLPAKATMVKRGGDGHQLWGHPHEPTAQYNHVAARSRSPPIVPWRLEVEGPGGEARDYFPHVLEITEQHDAAMSRTELVQAPGQAGVSLDAAGTPMVIRFSTLGPMAVRWRIGDSPEQSLGP